MCSRAAPPRPFAIIRRSISIFHENSGRTFGTRDTSAFTSNKQTRLSINRWTARAKGPVARYASVGRREDQNARVYIRFYSRVHPANVTGNEAGHAARSAAIKDLLHAATSFSEFMACIKSKRSRSMRPQQPCRSAPAASEKRIQRRRRIAGARGALRSASDKSCFAGVYHRAFRSRVFPGKGCV